MKTYILLSASAERPANRWPSFAVASLLALLQDSCAAHTGLEHPGSPLSSSFLLSGTCECQLNCSINCLCAEKQYLTERSEEDVTPAAAIIWKVAAN